MSGLRWTGLGAAYGRRRVFDGLDCTGIAHGSVTAVLGPNGCGKSTLLKALAGLLPCEGSVWLDAVRLDSLSRAGLAERVVYLPQSLPAPLRMSVFESVMVAANAGRSGWSVSSGSRDAEVMQILQQLGIASLADSHLDRLSGGQRQLAGLAQALIRRPALLLLDEPLSALDLHHQFHVMQCIREETRRRDMVTLVVLHDLNIALQHADRVLLLSDGRVAGEGAPADAITPATLARVYGVRARVESCSQGRPCVLVDGLLPA